MSQSSHSFLIVTHPIHFFYLPDLRFYLACSLVMIVSMHSHHHLKACMQLRQCVSLRTVCSRPFVRIGRQGLRLLRCFCLCGEHGCLSAAYRSLLRPCLYVLSRLLAACCVLLARCECVCCLRVRVRPASKQMRVDVDRSVVSSGVSAWQDWLRGICNVGSR